MWVRVGFAFRMTRWSPETTIFKKCHVYRNYIYVYISRELSTNWPTFFHEHMQHMNLKLCAKRIYVSTTTTFGNRLFPYFWRYVDCFFFGIPERYVDCFFFGLVILWDSKFITLILCIFTEGKSLLNNSRWRSFQNLIQPWEELGSIYSKLFLNIVMEGRFFKKIFKCEIQQICRYTRVSTFSTWKFNVHQEGNSREEGVVANNNDHRSKEMWLLNQTNYNFIKYRTFFYVKYLY